MNANLLTHCLLAKETIADVSGAGFYGFSPDQPRKDHHSKPVWAKEVIAIILSITSISEKSKYENSNTLQIKQIIPEQKEWIYT